MVTQTTNYAFNLPGVNDPADANIWGTQTNDNWSALDTDLKAVSDVADAAATPIVGALLAYAGATAPAKYLVCDGSAIDRTTYALLFTAIGTAWGVGNGTTTFNIPDLGGRVLAGKETVATRLTTAISGVDGATLAASGGDQRVQTHNHALTDPGHIHVVRTGSSAGSGIRGDASGTAFSGNTNSATTGITLADYGAGSSQNVQPTAIVNWLIFAGV